MKQVAIKVESKPSIARMYAGGAIIAACVAALAWLYWPRGSAPTSAPAEVEQRAERIADEIRQKEPASATERAPAATPATPGSGPENVRTKARGK